MSSWLGRRVGVSLPRRSYHQRITETEVQTDLMPRSNVTGMRSFVAALLLALTVLACAAPAAAADLNPCDGCRGGKSGVCPC